MIDTPQSLAVTFAPIGEATVDAQAAARIDAGARRLLVRVQLAIDDVGPGVEGFGAAGVELEGFTGSR